MPNARRRAKKAAKRKAVTGEIIPGVPAMQDGGFTGFGGLFGGTGSATIPTATTYNGGGGSYGGGGGDPFAQGYYDLAVRRADLELGQQWLDTQRANLDREAQIAIANADNASAERIATQRTQLEAEQTRITAEIAALDRLISQQQIAQGNRQIDASMRETDIDAQLTNISQQMQQWNDVANNALARGDQALAAWAQQQAAEAERYGLQLTQQAQQIDVLGLGVNAQLQQNNQMIDMYAQQVEMFRAQGDWAGARDAEARLRAAQQQNAVLDAYATEVQGYTGGLQGLATGVGALGNLATQAGNLRQRENEYLGNLLANPRDMMQYLYATGGANNFLDRMSQGLSPVGSSALGVGEGVPLLGENFNALSQRLLQAPDDSIMQQALALAQQLSQYAGQLPQAPTREEILALGALPPLSEMPQMPTAPQFAPITINTPAPINIPPPTPMPQLAAQPFNREARLRELIAQGMSAMTAWQQVTQEEAQYTGTPAPPNTTYTPPAPVPQPGPESIFNPVQAETYQGMQELAPTLPDWQVADIALNPGLFEQQVASTAPAPAPKPPPAPPPAQYPQGNPNINPNTGKPYTTQELAYLKTLETPEQRRLRESRGLAEGGEVVMTDEPIVGMGMLSGEPKFTVHDEFTDEYPLGVPEFLHGMQVTPMKEVTKMAGGGYAGITGMLKMRDQGGQPVMQGPTNLPARGMEDFRRRLLMERYRRGGFAPNRGYPDRPWMGGPPGIGRGIGQAPGLQVAPGLRPGMPVPPQYGIGGPGFQRPGDVSPWTLPYRPMSPGVIPQLSQSAPRPALDFRSLVGLGAQRPAPFQGGGSVLTNPGGLLRRLWAFTPRQYKALLPSQRDALFSVTSALGAPPEDAEFSLQQQAAPGVDPSRGLSASFARGGYVYAG